MQSSSCPLIPQWTQVTTPHDLKLTSPFLSRSSSTFPSHFPPMFFSIRILLSCSVSVILRSPSHWLYNATVIRLSQHVSDQYHFKQYNTELDDLGRRTVNQYAFVWKMHLWTSDFWPYTVSSCPWPLTFWSQNLISSSLSQLHRWNNHQRFVRYRVHKLSIWSLTHGRTHGQSENKMPSAAAKLPAKAQKRSTALPTMRAMSHYIVINFC